jgi:hypothetical protein
MPMTIMMAAPTEINIFRVQQYVQHNEHTEHLVYCHWNLYFYSQLEVLLADSSTDAVLQFHN